MQIANEIIAASIAATAAAATPETRREKMLRRGGPDNATNHQKGRPAFHRPAAFMAFHRNTVGMAELRATMAAFPG